ncbi:MAG: class I SAM-dependent methyltransferase [Anaerolineaceae bacterium]|nr:class I SAM-dependent methyltransferase [Anaerolineaceae bacterium]
METLKPEISVVNRNGLQYIKKQGKLIQYNPWLGNHFGFIYDTMMKHEVFPKTFGGSIEKHYSILNRLLSDVHQQHVLELATGTGSVIQFLANDNQYTGVDVSPDLLKRAGKRLRSSGFTETKLYIVSADDLPFQDQQFDLCLCILALNFFTTAEAVIKEVKRVLIPTGSFICCVPIPERNRLNKMINGTLYPEKELRRLCQNYNLSMQSYPDENGPLLYFKAENHA